MYKHNELTLDFSDNEKLLNKMRQLGGKAEYEINSYLWDKGGEILEKEVYKRLPRSNYKHYNKNQPKTHAKDTNSLEIIKYNLGVKVQTKTKPKSKDFGYLIFPDEGRGIRQKKKGSQEFFAKSLNAKEDKIADELIKKLNKKIEEEL